MTDHASPDLGHVMDGPMILSIDIAGVQPLPFGSVVGTDTTVGAAGARDGAGVIRRVQERADV